MLTRVDSGTRTNLNYMDNLAKFHKQRGCNLNRFPSVDKRPLDLYKLKKAVESRGGFEKVCKLKKWAEIGRDLGYSGKIMSSLSTSLKNSYSKWLQPYEEYLRYAKPTVHQQLEYEQGGPFTPPNVASPMGLHQHQGTLVSQYENSPTFHTTAALSAALKEPKDSPKPASTNSDRPPPPERIPPPEPPAVAGPISTGFTPLIQEVSPQ